MEMEEAKGVCAETQFIRYAGEEEETLKNKKYLSVNVHVIKH